MDKLITIKLLAETLGSAAGFGIACLHPQESAL